MLWAFDSVMEFKPRLVQTKEKESPMIVRQFKQLKINGPSASEFCSSTTAIIVLIGLPNEKVNKNISQKFGTKNYESTPISTAIFRRPILWYFLLSEWFGI